MNGFLIPSSTRAVLAFPFIFLAPILSHSSPACAAPLESGLQNIVRLKGAGGTFAAFSSDHRILTAGNDKAQLWDAKTFRAISEPFGNGSKIIMAAVDPKWHFFATANEMDVFLWDLALFKVLHVFHHPSQIYDVQFSHNGEMLATASADKCARLWSIDGKLLGKFEHEEAVASVTCSPGGDLLLTSTFGKTSPMDRTQFAGYIGHGDAHVWDIRKRVELWSFANTHFCQGRPAFNPDGTKVAVPCGGVAICEATTGKRLADWLSFTGVHGITTVTFDSTGRKLLATGDDGSDTIEGAMRLFDLARAGALENDDLLKQERVALPNCSLWTACLSPDGRSAIVVSRDQGDGNVTGVWNLVSGKQVLALCDHQENEGHSVSPTNVSCIAVSPAGDQVAFGCTSRDSRNTETLIWNFTSSRP